MMRLADNIPGKPHRWADAIGAWARGELVQWRYASTEATDADWRDCDYPSRGMPNWSYPGIEYRAALSSHPTPDLQAVRDETIASGQHKDLIRACNLAGLSYADCMRIVAYMPVLSHHEDGGRAATDKDSLTVAPVVALGGEPPCNPHPDAPHGYNRNASHNAGRYVCDCEGWAALGGEKGEAVAGEKLNELLDAYAEIAYQNGVEFCAGNEGDLEGELTAKRAVLALFAAPVGKARMLTDEEADHITGMHNTGRSQGDSECAEAIQRKFCEVNGITLEGGNRSGG